jgi:hypothetical protein
MHTNNQSVRARERERALPLVQAAFARSTPTERPSIGSSAEEGRWSEEEPSKRRRERSLLTSSFPFLFLFLFLLEIFPARGILVELSKCLLSLFLFRSLSAGSYALLLHVVLNGRCVLVLVLGGKKSVEKKLPRGTKFPPG